MYKNIHIYIDTHIYTYLLLSTSILSYTDLCHPFSFCYYFRPRPPSLPTNSLQAALPHLHFLFLPCPQPSPLLAISTHFLSLPSCGHAYFLWWRERGPRFSLPPLLLLVLPKILSVLPIPLPSPSTPPPVSSFLLTLPRLHRPSRNDHQVSPLPLPPLPPLPTHLHD